MKKYTKSITLFSTLSLLAGSFSITSCGKSSFTITWKNEDGTVLEIDENVPRNTTPTYDGPKPTKENNAQYTYVFTGWNSKVSPATKDMEYVAVFKNETNKYAVIWRNYDGSLLEADDNVPYGTVPTYDSVDPKRANTAEKEFTFTGWSPEVSEVTGNATYTATFKEEVRKYKITWKDEDGTVLKEEDVPYGTTPVYSGAEPTKTSTSKFSYKFDSWSPIITPVTGDMEYVAIYKEELRTYTITWVNYDGTVLEVDQNVPYGTTPTYNGETPTRTGRAMKYTWTGWDPMVLTVWGDQTYTAVYSGKPFFSFEKINYDLKDGYELSDLQGSPWINSNITGELNKINKPSLKDDYYASINYDKLVNGLDGAFDDCKTMVDQAFEAIFSDAETKNGDFIRAVYEKLEDGELNSVTNYLDNFDLDTYLNSKELFGNNGCLINILGNDNGYEVQFNDGYMNGIRGYPSLWMYGSFDGYSYVMDAVLNTVDAMSDIYNIPITASERTDIRNIESMLCSSPEIASSSVYGANTYTVASIPWSQMKNALLDLGLAGTDKVKIQKYYINTFNYLFNTYAVNKAAALSNAIKFRIAFDYRFLMGKDNYRSFSPKYSGIGFHPNEKDIASKHGKDFLDAFIKAALPILIEQAYIEIEGDEEIKQEVADLIDDILAAYKEMASEQTWLGRTTRNKVVEKLEYMRYESCYSDYYKNFAKVDVLDIDHASFLNLFNAYEDKLLQQSLDGIFEESGLWDNSGFPSYVVNAFYSPGNNSFVILNAITKGTMGTCIEEFYGMLGMVIGHEITHAFDSYGSLFDKEGNYNDWWTAADRRAFSNKVDKMISFYNKIHLTNDLTADGNNVNGEVTADMGGVKVMLHLAKKIEGFDYDRFFRSYADLWLRKTISDSEVPERASDEHPFNYLRCNVTLGQFDEFIETYDIQPGDGMYIPQEDRVKIW